MPLATTSQLQELITTLQTRRGKAMPLARLEVSHRHGALVQQLRDIVGEGVVKWAIPGLTMEEDIPDVVTIDDSSDDEVVWGTGTGAVLEDTEFVFDFGGTMG